MRTLQNPSRKFPWEEHAFSVRSVQISAVLVSKFPGFRGLRRTRLEKVFLTDWRLFEIQTETSFMLKKPHNLTFVPVPPFFLFLC